MFSMFVVFATLKLCNIIQWDWVIVCIPLFYFMIEIGFGLLILFLFYGCFRTNYKKHRSKMPDLSNSITKMKSFNDSLTNVMVKESHKDDNDDGKDLNHERDNSLG